MENVPEKMQMPARLVPGVVLESDTVCTTNVHDWTSPYPKGAAHSIPPKQISFIFFHGFQSLEISYYMIHIGKNSWNQFSRDGHTK